MIETMRRAGFDVVAKNHAAGILTGEFGARLREITEVLLDFRMHERDLIMSGGGQAASTMRLRDGLYAAGWHKHEFVTRVTVDGVEREATTHEVDHVSRDPAGTLALEIEWNNKDPFFDRDLENFHRLHGLGAISVGIVVTRGAALQAAMAGMVQGVLEREGIGDPQELLDWGMKARTVRQMGKLGGQMAKGVPFAEAFARQFVADKFGPATTHWSKLMERVDRGVGNPCPLLLIGLPRSCVVT